MSASKALRLGDKSPNFQADTTYGPIDFHAWKGSSWAILFSHPEDFTPVCTTELGAVARLQPEWEKRNVKVIGLSCNTLESHEQWIADINETQNCQVRFPIIADKSRTVATLYGMLDHQDPTNIDKLGMPFTVRSVFVLGPDHEIRLTITYPASTGRNFTEILRCVDALQLTDKRRVATPADWRPGDDVVVHASVGAEEAKRLFPEHRVVKPYLRMTKLDVEKP